jgi:hypothetical protein
MTWNLQFALKDKLAMVPNASIFSSIRTIDVLLNWKDAMFGSVRLAEHAVAMRSHEF